MLVADGSEILHLDASGSILPTTYNPSGAPGWTSLALDPDGHSFWACNVPGPPGPDDIDNDGDGAPDHNFAYKFDIQSGQSEMMIDTGQNILKGIEVCAEPRAAIVPMAIQPPMDQNSVEGAAHAFQLGSLTDSAGAGPWNVTVQWGDSTPDTTFQVASLGALPTQTHTYDEGIRTVTVKVTDVADGNSTSNTFQTKTSDPALLAKGGFTVVPVNGVVTDQTVATFTDPAGAEPCAWDDPGGQLSNHYSATIDWGDGVFPSSGVITYSGSPGSTTGKFTVTGSHHYISNGLHNITVYIFHETHISKVSSKAVELKVSPPANQSAVEGASQNFHLGSFVDAGSGPWTVAVNWGDGPRDNLFLEVIVPGLFGFGTWSHSYGEEGMYTVTVRVTNNVTGKSASTTFQVTVSDPPPVAVGGFTITASEGVPCPSQTVATFTDPGGPEPNASDDPGGLISNHYKALINWGDQTPQSLGQISLNAQNVFVVQGSHTYMTNGTHFLIVTIIHEGIRSNTVYSTAIMVSVTRTKDRTANEGASQLFTLGSFTDPTGQGPWKVDVNWDDGTPDKTFQKTTTGSLGTASHTYGEEAVYFVTVTVTDTANGNSAYTTFKVVVTDPPMAATGGLIMAVQGIPLTTQTVATFTDPGGPEPNASDNHGVLVSDHYTAMIDWGDNTMPSVGTITLGPGGVFSVTGDHTYTIAGDYAVVVTIDHEDQISKVSDKAVVKPGGT
jgi:hypothetical protein